MDQDSALAGVSSLSQRDQRGSQDPALVGASQAREPQTGVLRLWSEGHADGRGLRAGDTRSSVVGIPHHGSDRALTRALSGARDQGRKRTPAPEQGTFQ